MFEKLSSPIIDFCKLAGEAGVDVLDISRGNILSAGLKYEVPPVDIPRAFNIDNAAKPETVLVAGGGIGGLEAAIILKQRGHNPILCEASDQLGGQN